MIDSKRLGYASVGWVVVVIHPHFLCNPMSFWIFQRPFKIAIVTNTHVYIAVLVCFIAS